MDAPRSVRYQDQSRAAYLVREINDSQHVRVAKQRAVADTYPPNAAARSADMRLLRWSGYALLGVLLGGVGAIILGLLTASLAALLLMRHSHRVRAWRRAHRAAGSDSSNALLLPAAASDERARLRTALWQGVIAAVLGLVFLFALLDRLP